MQTNNLFLRFTKKGCDLAEAVSRNIFGTFGIGLTLLFVASGCARHQSPGSNISSDFAIPQESAQAPQGALLGNRVGNGGDDVRKRFIEMGEVVVRFLRNHPVGQNLLRDNGFRAPHNLIDRLEAILTIEHISTKNGILTDNRGAHVDAVYDKNNHLISLSVDRWTDHFDRDRDVYYLVFHEMLRAVGINDDDYKLSKGISPFPATEKIRSKRLETQPLLIEESILPIIDVTRISLSGTGCEALQRHTFVELDATQNVLEVTPLNFSLGSILNFFVSVGDMKNCALTIPINIPAGRQLLVTQVELQSGITLNPADNYEIGVNVAFAGEETRQFRKPIERALNKNTIGRSLTRFTPHHVWSPCDKPEQLLNVDTVATLTGSTNSLVSPSFASVEKIKIYFDTQSCLPLGARAF